MIVYKVFYKNYYAEWECCDCDKICTYLPPREDDEIIEVCRDCDGLTFYDGDGGEIDRAEIEWRC